MAARLFLFEAMPSTPAWMSQRMRGGLKRLAAKQHHLVLPAGSIHFEPSCSNTKRQPKVSERNVLVVPGHLSCQTNAGFRTMAAGQLRRAWTPVPRVFFELFTFGIVVMSPLEGSSFCTPHSFSARTHVSLSVKHLAPETVCSVFLQGLCRGAAGLLTRATIASSVHVARSAKALTLLAAMLTDRSYQRPSWKPQISCCDHGEPNAVFQWEAYFCQSCLLPFDFCCFCGFLCFAPGFPFYLLLLLVVSCLFVLLLLCLSAFLPFFLPSAGSYFSFSACSCFCFCFSTFPLVCFCAFQLFALCFYVSLLCSSAFLLVGFTFLVPRFKSRSAPPFSCQPFWFYSAPKH